MNPKMVSQQLTTVCVKCTRHMKHEKWKYQVNKVKIATETRRHVAHNKDSMMIEIIKQPNKFSYSPIVMDFELNGEIVSQQTIFLRQKYKIIIINERMNYANLKRFEGKQKPNWLWQKYRVR